MIDSKRIAKNTLFMYIRMFIILGVSLYTSRVVLDKLGVDDYGLYNVVAGLVGMLSFLNGTLSTGTSRFLMYDLGVGDTNKLKSTFNTVLITHVALACFIIPAASTQRQILICAAADNNPSLTPTERTTKSSSG